MLYEYIINNYEKDEPIFLSELPGNSKNYIRQEMKQLTDSGKLTRLYNGVYFLTYTTILGTKGKVSVDKFIKKKYLEDKSGVLGYITGIGLANMYGFTTQNPSCIEICSNVATTKQRKKEIEGQKVIIYKPPIKITSQNMSALQFLDFMTTIDKYCELSEDELKTKLLEFVKLLNVDFTQVKEYIMLYPDKVYKNIYQGGLMRELV